jgi:hypothetical protein
VSERLGLESGEWSLFLASHLKQCLEYGPCEFRSCESIDTQCLIDGGPRVDVALWDASDARQDAIVRNQLRSGTPRPVTDVIREELAQALKESDCFSEPRTKLIWISCRSNNECVLLESGEDGARQGLIVTRAVKCTLDRSENLVL